MKGVRERDRDREKKRESGKRRERRRREKETWEKAEKQKGSRIRREVRHKLIRQKAFNHK